MFVMLTNYQILCCVCLPASIVVQSDTKARGLGMTDSQEPKCKELRARTPKRIVSASHVCNLSCALNFVEGNPITFSSNAVVGFNNLLRSVY